MDFKIERGIHLHDVEGDLGFSRVMRLLKAGESVVIPRSPAGVNAIAHRVMGTGKYALRKVEGGCRIWKIK